MIENFSKELIIQRLLAISLLVVLIILCFMVVRFFIVPALWAAIIAYVTYPLYNFFHQKVKLSSDMSSGIMTISISLLIGIPLVIGLFVLQQEALSLYGTLIRRLKARICLWLGNKLKIPYGKLTKILKVPCLL